MSIDDHSKPLCQKVLFPDELQLFDVHPSIFKKLGIPWACQPFPSFETNSQQANQKLDGTKISTSVGSENLTQVTFF